MTWLYAKWIAPLLSRELAFCSRLPLQTQAGSSLGHGNEAPGRSFLGRPELQGP